MSNWPTGVSIITTIHEGQKFGFTANSVTSVSMSPLLMSCCIKNISTTLEAIKASQKFTINILSEPQADLAKSFSKHDKIDRFEDVKYSTSSNGHIYIENILGHIECTVYEIYPAGDHNIVIGTVQNMQFDDSKKPLLFLNRKFHNTSQIS
jgi:flavin reductase (DIM6/NTAB) family NADH-FMN oxidoreductase RutF